MVRRKVRPGRKPVSAARRRRVGTRGLVGLGIRRRQTPQQITEARGPAACLRRDALFRRMLLVADVVAIAGTFVVVTQLSSRSLQLTWLSIVGLPLLLIGAKLFGLYDRDETLLRKTTLDEVPKLFHLATLCALTAWLGERTDRQRRLSASPRSARPVGGAARRAGAGARDGSGARAAPRAGRALPVRRR